MRSVRTVTVPPRRALLLRRSAFGDFEDAGPRPLPPPGPLLRWTRPAVAPLSCVMRARTAEPVAALTYDDGPDPEQTPRLLDVLAEHGARATFFVLTDAAEAHPDVIHRALAEGHEIALHGIDHARLTDVPGALRRIRTGKQRLEAITGRPVRWYRPTYGDIGPVALAGSRALGMDVVLWSAWARDWEQDEPERVAARALHALHPGAVVLLHDRTDDAEAAGAGLAPTFSRADVTRRLLHGMSTQGYRAISLGELIGRYPAARAVTVRRPARPSLAGLLRRP